MLALTSVLVAASLGAPLAKCPSLAGNWTSSTDGKGEIVHLEFFEADGDASFTVRATPWGAAVSAFRAGRTRARTHAHYITHSRRPFMLTDESQRHINVKLWSCWPTLPACWAKVP
jgi:hypothetical protein